MPAAPAASALRVLPSRVSNTSGCSCNDRMHRCHAQPSKRRPFFGTTVRSMRAMRSPAGDCLCDMSAIHVRDPPGAPIDPPSRRQAGRRARSATTGARPELTERFVRIFIVSPPGSHDRRGVVDRLAVAQGHHAQYPPTRVARIAHSTPEAQPATVLHFAPQRSGDHIHAPRLVDVGTLAQHLLSKTPPRLHGRVPASVCGPSTACRAPAGS